MGSLAPGLDLYWIPLGAGSRVVTISGKVYEGLKAAAERRPRQSLYHSALVARVLEGEVVMEVTPVPDSEGPRRRGVVAEGAVGARWLERLRTFRYEVRRWPQGVIPDLGFAVGDPVPLTSDLGTVEAVIHAIAEVPTPVWGRDSLGAGDMWNSNSVISWTLARAGLDAAALHPPRQGRAPGWEAGLVAAGRGLVGSQAAPC